MRSIECCVAIGKISTDTMHRASLGDSGASCCWLNLHLFFCHAMSAKRHEIRIELTWKANKKSYVICRTAPLSITLNGPNCWNCFWILLLVRAQLFQCMRPIFALFSGLVALPAQMIAVKLDCDRSRDVAMATNFCIQSTQFFRHSYHCVIHTVHSATTRSTVVGVIHEVDRRRGLSTTPLHRKTDIVPPGYIPLGHFPDSHLRRDTTKCKCCAGRI